MATTLGVWQLFDGESIAFGASATSAGVEMGTASALALHLTAITGTLPDVTFTYQLSNSKDGAGTYVVPQSPATIGANLAAVDVMDFAPELARYIQIIATNNSGANAAVITAQLAIQEL